MSPIHGARPAPLGTALVVAAALLAAPVSARANHWGSGPEGGEAATDPNNPTCNEEGAQYTDASSGGGTGSNQTEPVSPVTGNWIYRHVDLEVPGVLPIRMVRRYDSQTRYQSFLGAGWAFTFDLALFEYGDGSVIIRNTCGVRHKYYFTGGAYSIETDTPAWRRTLADDPHVTGGYILSSPQGWQWFFDAEWRLSTIQDPQGNQLELSYSATKHAITGTSIHSISLPPAIHVCPTWRLQACLTTA